MNLFDKVSGDIKTAMLARDKVRLEALRGIKKEFLEAKTAKGGDGELSDDAALKILAKMVKQRKESASIYTEQNREDLAGEELAQAAIIEEYLPKQLSEEELTAALNGRGGGKPNFQQGSVKAAEAEIQAFFEKRGFKKGKI